LLMIKQFFGVKINDYELINFIVKTSVCGG
jgi:hypothetical protein